ncbi:MAG: HAD family hydrolase [Chitinophagia bacterium]|nr:HAD family hydrolase [Chitinophagia bacterium]
MMAPKHIIFDLDGTLIDSRNEIQNTYSKVFERYSPIPGTNVAHLNYGASIKEVLKEVYGNNEALQMQAKDAFADIYDSSDYTDTLLYPGVKETLEHLQEKGFILHIATNKRYYPTLRILERKKINTYFTTVVGNEIKPGIFTLKRQMIATIKGMHSFELGYMVGDSVGDIEGGKEEGLLTIAVTYGYDDRARLQTCAPTFMIDSINQLTGILSD